jgi:hypothetical protein
MTVDTWFYDDFSDLPSRVTCQQLVKNAAAAAAAGDGYEVPEFAAGDYRFHHQPVVRCHTLHRQQLTTPTRNVSSSSAKTSTHAAAAAAAAAEAGAAVRRVRAEQ